MPHAYKVLRQDLTNVGLLGAPTMQYRFDTWNTPMEELSDHPLKGGGLWTAPTLGDARGWGKYVLKQHGIRTRIFRCCIGQILHQTSCRIKTDKLRFSEGDEV